MLSIEQLKAIAGILSDLGQICIASVVIPFVFPSFAEDALPTIVLGLLLAIFFWTLSILSVRSLN